MFKKNVKAVFAEVCHNAYWNGVHYASGHHRRTDRTDPRMQPGYYYNNLPEETRELLKNELTSDITKDLMISVFKDCGPNEAWWEPRAKTGDNWVSREKLKFEAELMKHGWQPNYKL